MAMLDLGTLKIGVEVQTGDSNEQFDTLKQTSKETATSVGTDWTKVAATLTTVGTTLTKYVTLPIIAAATASVKYASDLTETTNKVNQVFNENAEAVTSWAENSISQMGLAKETAMDMAASFGDLGSSMKLTGDLNYEYSTSLVQLAADMASFKNISSDRAQTALTGIYTGETEALKALGIVMTQANLEAYALANGYTKQYDELTQAELVTLRYEYVMDAASNSMGDFARTSDETANQTRMLGENVKELGAEFGEVLAPTANDIIQKLNGVLDKLKNLNPESKKAAVNAALIAAAIGPLLTMIGKGIKAYQDIATKVAAANVKMQASAGVIGAVSLAIGLLAAAVIVGVKNYKELTEAANDLKNATKDASAEIQDSKDSLNDTLVAVEASAQMAQTYCDRLDELSAAESLTNAQRAEAQYLVDQLNELYPELNAQIDEQTGKIIDGTTAIRDQIVAMQERAQAAAYEEQYNAVLEAHADLIYAAAAAETERSMILQRNSEIVQEMTDLTTGFEEATGHSISAMAELDSVSQDALLNGDAAAKKMLNRYMALDIELDENKVSLSALNRELKKNEEATEDAAYEVDIATQTYEGLTTANEDLVPALSDTSDAITDTGEAATEAADDVKDYTDETINNLEKLPNAVKMTAAQATANLQANNVTMTQWITDLTMLVEKGMDEGVVAKLYEMGPEFRSVVADLVDSTPEEMQAFADALEASGDLSGQKFTAGVESATEDTTAALSSKKEEVEAWTAETTAAIAECVDTGIIAKLNTIVPAYTEILTNLLLANATQMPTFAQSMLDWGATGGNNFVLGVGTSIKSKYQMLYMIGYNAGLKVTQGYNDAQEIRSPSRVGWRSGGQWIQGIVNGVVDNLKDLQTVSAQAASVPIDAIKAQLSSMPKITSGAMTKAATVNNVQNTTVSNNAASKSIVQNNNFSATPKTQYEIYLAQKQLSKNLAEAVS